MTDNRDLAISTRIRLAMTDAGLTQAELAQAAELTPDKFSKILTGKRRVSSLELALIAQATGWSVEKLLGMEIRVYAYPPRVTEQMVAAAVRAINGEGAVLYIGTVRVALEAAMAAAVPADTTGEGV